LEARELAAGDRVTGVDLVVAEGEVLGLAGLLGSGRSEVARALTGVDRATSGAVIFDGRAVSPRTPRQASARGLTYSSENRRAEGIIGELSGQENSTLALQAQRGSLRQMRRSRQRELASSWIEALDIRPASPDTPAG